MGTAAHVVITRFCCRSNWAGPRAGVYWKKKMDPLRRTNVVRRFALFEAVCLPNVLAQTCQDFAWVILVDKDLRANDRDRLSRLCAQRSRTFLHTYNGEDLRLVEWLRPYLPGEVSRVITTLWDDDDALPEGYISCLRSRFATTDDHWSPLRTAGSKSCVQWDMLMGREHPFGTTAPWHRGNFPKSPGFSVLSSLPCNVSVLGMDHALGEVWYAKKRGVQLSELLMQHTGEGSNPYLEQLLDQFQQWLQAADLLSRCEQSPEGLFCNLTGETGAVLMTNHGANAQTARLWEAKSGTDTVRGATSFDDFVIDWPVLHRNRRLFSPGRIRAEALLDRFMRGLDKVRRRWP